MVDFVSQQFIESGNYSVLPRSYLKLVQLSKSEGRLTNKLLKKNIRVHENYQEFVFNPVPYEFTFEFVFFCRGMNEASQIIEAVQTKFNPTLDIDIWDQQNLETPTRIPVKLLDIQIDDDGYSETSTNIIEISCSLSLDGQLYSPNTLDVKRSELNPCDDSEYDSSDLNVELTNSRIMPIIKQVGYSLRASSSPEERITSGISTIDLFDVDEHGHIICKKPEIRDRFNHQQEFNSILSLIDEIESIKAELELDDNPNNYQEYLNIMKDNLQKISEINYIHKGNIIQSTQSEVRYKILKVEEIINSDEMTDNKLIEIKNILSV